MGPADFGLDAPTVDELARELVEVHAAGRRARARDRRRQHLPRHEGDRRRDGPRDRRLHGDARDRVQLARGAGGARAERRRHARALGARRARGGRAVHPPPRDPAPREGPGRDLRGRHRQPVLHDRHGGRAARARDRRRGDPDGQERRSRRLRRRPAHEPDGDVPAGDHAPPGDRARPEGDGHDRALPLHGQQSPDPRVRARSGQHRAGRCRGERRHAHLDARPKE